LLLVRFEVRHGDRKGRTFVEFTLDTNVSVQQLNQLFGDVQS
jgi:hypothetical protein